MSDTPVLVVGATGNVGAAVVLDLVAAGVRVRAAASTAASVRARFGELVDAVALDFTDAATWEAAFDGVERMFLMRPPQLGRPKQEMLPALEHAKRVGVRHIVFLSLQGADRNRVVPHAVIEAWLTGQQEIAYTFVRASFFMQNLSTTHAADIRDEDRIIVPAGGGATAFVDAVDVAAVAAAALLNPDVHRNTAWTPTGPEALTYDEVAGILSAELDRPIRYTRPGVTRYALNARRRLRMPWGMVLVTSVIYSVARFGRAGRLTDDVRTVTGRAPTSFADFAARARSTWLVPYPPP